MTEQELFGSKPRPQLSEEECERLRLFRECSNEIARQIVERINCIPFTRLCLEQTATKLDNDYAININANFNGWWGPFADWGPAAKLMFKDDRANNKIILTIASSIDTEIYIGSITPEDVKNGSPISFGAMMIDRAGTVLNRCFLSTPRFSNLTPG